MEKKRLLEDRLSSSVCSDICSSRTRTVIETTILRGTGKGDDLARFVTQYWSEKGELLAERDLLLNADIHRRNNIDEDLKEYYWKNFRVKF